MITISATTITLDRPAYQILTGLGHNPNRVLLAMREVLVTVSVPIQMPTLYGQLSLVVLTDWELSQVIGVLNPSGGPV